MTLDFKRLSTILLLAAGLLVNFLAGAGQVVDRSIKNFDAVKSNSRAGDNSVIGKVVVGVKRDEMPAKSGDLCVPIKGSVFNGEKLADAYRFVDRERPKPGEGITISRATAKVIVVDNGFFGADPRKKSRMFENSPFEKQYFQYDEDAFIAKTLSFAGQSSGSGISRPLNDSGKLSITPETGHGTHVAGLILGGPDFHNQRDGISSAAPWVQIVVLNIGRGGTELLNHSEVVLQAAINDEKPWPSIVNMSIAYDARIERAVKKEFEDIIDRGLSQETLFVVAAGNDWNLVSKVEAYPAAFGGHSGKPNVVTVAALDGNGYLAPFSNRGKDVDIAAPGCEIPSWISNVFNTVKISGTSQATPLVTFAASLIKSLANQISAKKIKIRLIASGDLLDSEDFALTAYGVSLNIQKSLYLFDDYLAVTTEEGIAYLGTVEKIEKFACNNARGKGLEPVGIEDLQAFKQTQFQGWIFAGREKNGIEEPCLWNGDSKAQLLFLARTKIVDGKLTSIDGDPPELKLKMSEVRDLVIRSDF